MKKIYLRIWELAKPLYLEGRPMDIEHVEWLIDTIPKYVSEDELDYDVLLPLAILHDVGYSKVPKNSNSYNLDIRRLHMKEGVKLAKEILEKLNYPENKTNEICRLISKHDDWAFGDSFADDKLLLAFQNFDFIWMVSEKGFDLVRTHLKIKMNSKEFIKHIKDAQVANIKRGTLWFSKKIENLYETLLEERKKENET